MPKPRHWPMEKLPTPVFPAPLTKFSALLDLLSPPSRTKTATMRRHLNHPAHRARRPRPSLLSGVETLRRLEVARLLRRLRAQAAPEHLWRLCLASATTLPSLWGLGRAHRQVRFHSPCCCEILYLCITTGHPASSPSSRPGHGHHSSQGTSPSQGSACARLPWPSASLAGSRPGG